MAAHVCSAHSRHQPAELFRSPNRSRSCAADAPIACRYTSVQVRKDIILGRYGGGEVVDNAGLDGQG